MSHAETADLLQKFIDREVERKREGLYSQAKRDEAIELFSTLTKQLGFTIEITYDDGDTISFKMTTRFSLSRRELEELMDDGS